jgi:hypothetical protein
MPPKKTSKKKTKNQASNALAKAVSGPPTKHIYHPPDLKTGFRLLERSEHSGQEKNELFDMGFEEGFNYGFDRVHQYANPKILGALPGNTQWVQKDAYTKLFIPVSPSFMYDRYHTQDENSTLSKQLNALIGTDAKGKAKYSRAMSEDGFAEGLQRASMSRLLNAKPLIYNLDTPEGPLFNISKIHEKAIRNPHVAAQYLDDLISAPTNEKRLFDDFMSRTKY